MNISFPLLLGALGLAGTSVALAAFNAPSPVPFKDLHIHTVAMDHGQGEHRGPRFSKEDRSAFFDAHVAALHAGLTLTPDQEKFWPPLESALRDNRKAMQDYWESRRDQWEKFHSEQPAKGDEKQGEQNPMPDPVAMLKSRAEFEMMRGQRLKAIADAAAPLYGSLNDNQKNRVPMLMSFFQEPDHGPMRPHMAMDDHMREGEHDRGGMHGWMRHHGHDEGDGDEAPERGMGIEPPPPPHPGPKQ
jgi:hypothetical protein